MALNSESFDILLAIVQRFIRERLVPPRTTSKNATRRRPTSSKK